MRYVLQIDMNELVNFQSALQHGNLKFTKVVVVVACFVTKVYNSFNTGMSLKISTARYKSILNSRCKSPKNITITIIFVYFF